MLDGSAGAGRFRGKRCVPGSLINHGEAEKYRRGEEKSVEEEVSRISKNKDLLAHQRKKNFTKETKNVFAFGISLPNPFSLLW